MPTIISGPRRARSSTTPSGASTTTRVLDFNFASDQGIQIEAVLGSLSARDVDPAPSDTVPATIAVAQSLHLEEGTIEDLPFTIGEDGDSIDTEVFFSQDALGMFQTGTTNTFGAGGAGPSSVLYVPFRDPILVARNITHRGESGATGQDGLCKVLIYYRYVRFSLKELGLVLARRQ